MKSKSEILKLLGGIPEEVYDSICSSFYTEARKNVEKLQAAIAASDYPAVVKLAHAVKGSASNLYLEDIFEAARSLEAAAKGQDAAKIQQFFLILKSSFQ